MPFASSRWCVGFSGRVLLWCSLLAFGLAAGGTPSASAQTALELQRQVDAPGEGAFKGRLLPPNTTVVTIPYSAEQPHTLENAGMSREDLSRLVLERLRVRNDTVRVTDQWRTDQTFSPTSQSGELLYVLARTPADSLYETYVYTGDGFVPGFDAVESGRMTMGPVPPEAARRYRATFRVYRKEAGGGTKTANTQTDPPGDAPPTRASDTSAATASQGSPSPDTISQNRTASTHSSSSGGVWAFFIGALLGGVVGGGLGWYLSTRRIDELERERTGLERRMNRQKSADFREATGASLSSSEEGSAESGPVDVDRLQKKNEELREENQTLRDEIHEIRRYVETLHEERS